MPPDWLVVTGMILSLLLSVCSLVLKTRRFPAALPALFFRKQAHHRD
jgi:hypothetical protein